MSVLFLILIILNSIALFGQFDAPYTSLDTARYQITYSLKYQEDSLSPSYIRQEDMLLFVGKRQSMFQSLSLYLGDSIARRIPTPEMFAAYFNNNVRAPRPVLLFQIFKNYPAGKNTVTEHLIGSSFLYEEDRPVCQWQLTGETKEMYGRKAQKAVCRYGGREWVAWFTPEIPINDGPYKFDGLPGLIILLHDSKKHYSFEFISIKELKHLVVIDLKQYDYVKGGRLDYIRAREKNHAEVQRRLKDVGADQTTLIEVYRKLARKNNPIKLK